MNRESLPKVLASLPCPEALLCVKNAHGTDVITVTTMFVSHDPVIAAVYLKPSSFAHRLVNESRNFTLNVVDESQNRQALMAGSLQGDDPGKLQKLGLFMVPSQTIDSPAIEGAVASYECRVLKAAACGTHDLFLGLVTGWTVREDGRPVVRYHGKSHSLGAPLEGPDVAYPH